MEMEDGLARTGANVDHGAVPIFDAALAGDLRGGEVTSANDRGVLDRRLFEPRNVLLWNDEHMSRALGVQVFEGENVVIFVDFSRRDFAAQKAAKKTVNHTFHF